MTRRFICKVLLVVAAFGFLLLTGTVSAQGHSEQQVKAVQEKHTVKLMAIKGVVGTAIGHDREDQPDIKVFVEDEGVTGLPKKLDDVSVEVVVTGKIYALKGGGKPSTPINPAARFPRPVPIGVSTGHPAITAGTIGCRVTKGNNVYALSNNHVYANMNEATIGDNVLQPGHYDGGINPDDAIGTLFNFVSIDFSGGDNTVDAAIAGILNLNNGISPCVGKSTPSNGYGTPKSTPVPASINMQVQKYGRTTGLTKGKIYAIDGIVNVEYAPGKVARFVGQLIITPGSFSSGGDSGSLIVTKSRDLSKDRQPVGLLFAGSNLYTIANPIDMVLGSLGVSIDGE